MNVKINLNIPILFIIGSLDVGGSERQIYYLLELLKKNKYNLHLVVWSCKGTEKYFHDLKKLGIPIVYFDKKLNALKKVLQLKRLINKINPQIVQSYSYYLNFISHLCCIGTKSKFIGAIRGQVPDLQLISSAISLFLNLNIPKYIISNNEISANQIKESNKFFKNQEIFVITNKLKTEQFEPSSYIWDDEIISCSIGRIDKNKNIQFIVEIIDNLNKLGYNVKHYHAGVGVEEENVRKKINSLNLSNKFILSGIVEDIPGFLKKANLFLHTPVFEGMPNVIMEAKASGLPLVTSRYNKDECMIKNGINGFIIEDFNVDDYVNKILLIFNDVELRKKIHLTNIMESKKEFDIKTLLDESLYCYNKIINS